MTNDELEDYVCNWGGDMISNIKAAQKILPAWFFARMMEDVWVFGESIINYIYTTKKLMEKSL